MKRIFRTWCVAAILVAGFTAYMTVTFLIARKRAQTNACGGYMRLMDSAKEQWAMAHHLTNGPTDVAGVLDFIRDHRLPKCPGGGTYSIGNVGEMPTCSVHGTITNRHYPHWWE